MENYTKFSQNLNNSEEIKEEQIIHTELVDANLVDGLNVEMIEDPVIEEVVITNEPVKLVQEVKGVVVNCNKLNVRKEANKDSEVLVVINKNEEVTITIEDSTEDFYKVTTATGIEGYCMKQFINVK